MVALFWRVFGALLALVFVVAGGAGALLAYENPGRGTPAWEYVATGAVTALLGLVFLVRALRGTGDVVNLGPAVDDARARIKVIKKRAQPGRVVLRDFRRTGEGDEGQERVLVTLEAHPTGAAPFRVDDERRLDEDLAKTLAVGATYAARIDPAAPDYVLVDWGDGRYDGPVVKL